MRCARIQLVVIDFKRIHCRHDALDNQMKVTRSSNEGSMLCFHCRVKRVFLGCLRKFDHACMTLADLVQPGKAKCFQPQDVTFKYDAMAQTREVYLANFKTVLILIREEPY